MRQQPVSRSEVFYTLEEVAARFRVSRRTLQRWRQWWLTAFVETRFWREASGRFMPPVEAASLPRSLFERFTASSGEHALVLRLLRFLGPVTTSSMALRAS